MNNSRQDSLWNPNHNMQHLASTFQRKTGYYCYELKSLGLDKRTTLILSNTRELDRVPNTE